MLLLTPTVPTASCLPLYVVICTSSVLYPHFSPAPHQWYLHTICSERPCKEVPCKSPCGLQTEFPDDTLINSSCCQMLLALTFRTVCINNKYLHLEIVYVKYCAPVTATDSSSGLGERETLQWIPRACCDCRAVPSAAHPCPRGCCMAKRLRKSFPAAL